MVVFLFFPPAPKAPILVDTPTFCCSKHSVLCSSSTICLPLPSGGRELCDLKGFLCLSLCSLEAGYLTSLFNQEEKEEKEACAVVAADAADVAVPVVVVRGLAVAGPFPRLLFQLHVLAAAAAAAIPPFTCVCSRKGRKEEENSLFLVRRRRLLRARGTSSVISRSAFAKKSGRKSEGGGDLQQKLEGHFC